MTPKERAMGLFRNGVAPTPQKVAAAIEVAEQEAIKRAPGGRGCLRDWPPSARKLFSGTRTTEDRHAAVSACGDLTLLQAMADDPLLGAQYRKRCRGRINRLTTERKKRKAK